MIATILHEGTKFSIDLANPLDISIPLRDATHNPQAWYVEGPKFTPVKTADWVGSVKKGGSVNFNNLYFNPHAHGTHTECVGHITEEVYSINQYLQNFFFLCELVSIQPQAVGDDLLITKELIENALQFDKMKALAIRTLPNDFSKTSKNYNHSNPPYLTEDAAIFVRDLGIEHLLVDLPSVDKEKDGGKLLAHNAFWNTSGEIRFYATISEFIYVPDAVQDGLYFLNLQIAPFENDAAPSKPILYKLLD